MCISGQIRKVKRRAAYTYICIYIYPIYVYAHCADIQTETQGERERARVRAKDRGGKKYVGAEGLVGSWACQAGLHSCQEQERIISIVTA